MTGDIEHLRHAVRLARENVTLRHGRPFGAVLTRDGHVLATGVNEMLATGDASAHAEMQAIRTARIAQRSPRLDGTAMYASGQPCPMCLALMHMVGVAEVYYACSNEDGEPYGLSTAAVYAEMAKPLAEHRIRIAHAPLDDGSGSLYELWRSLNPG